MRYPLAILVILYSICFVRIPVFAADVLLGTVVSAKQETGEVVVRIDNGEDLTVLFEPDHFPQNIKTDTLIRVWGDYVKNGNTMIFQASSTSGCCCWMRGKDPTGVRSRLGKRRGMMQGRMSGGGRGNKQH